MTGMRTIGRYRSGQQFKELQVSSPNGPGLGGTPGSGDGSYPARLPPGPRIRDPALAPGPRSAGAANRARRRRGAAPAAAGRVIGDWILAGMSPVAAPDLSSPRPGGPERTDVVGIEAHRAASYPFPICPVRCPSRPACGAAPTAACDGRRAAGILEPTTRIDVGGRPRGRCGRRCRFGASTRGAR